jgi:murein DD-endopeptidase MepM/ murein hydrolase activator NlpD/FtsZ-binding cell division protein ZapB
MSADTTEESPYHNPSSWLSWIAAAAIIALALVIGANWDGLPQDSLAPLKGNITPTTADSTEVTTEKDLSTRVQQLEKQLNQLTTEQEELKNQNNTLTDKVEALHYQRNQLFEENKQLGGRRSLPEVVLSPVIDGEDHWVDIRIKRGDTLTTIFKRYGFTTAVALEVARLPVARPLNRLKIGRRLQIKATEDGKFDSLRYEYEKNIFLVVTNGPEGVQASRGQPDLRSEQRQTSSYIDSSLHAAAKSAGLTERMIVELQSIFGWDIDFARQLKDGDQFAVVYDERFWGNEKVENGPILAAEFTNNGNRLRAIRHLDEEGGEHYFTPQGENLRGTFLRAPVKVVRITSRFTQRRFHPLLKTWRAHRGVDYGAPRGTPVFATAEGQVEYIGRKGNYGKTIIIKHGGIYSTLYAHLSGYAKKSRRGARIKQGELIGYVGSTGAATGAHLHYEFRVHNKHQDPLNYETPRAPGISDSEKVVFDQVANRMTLLLDQASGLKLTSTSEVKALEDQDGVLSQ